MSATGSSAKLIRYISNAQVTINVTAKNSATIVEKMCLNSGQLLKTSPYIFNEIRNDSFQVSCTDSRKFTSSKLYNPTMVEYIKPAITNCVLDRATTTSNTIKLSLEGQFFNGSFGAKTNTLTLKYRYKKFTTTTWGSYITITATKNGNKFTYTGTLGSTFDYTQSYDFEFVATDIFLSDTVPVPLTRGFPIMDIGQEDVKVNGQIFMGDNKVLAFVVTDSWE